MNSLISKRENKIYTKNFLLSFLLLGIVYVTPAMGWEIDMSRRSRDFKKARPESLNRLPASLVKTEEFSAVGTTESQSSFVSEVFRTGEPVQDVVIMATEKGFIPTTLRLRRDQTYKIHIVNVNPNEKNTSFIMDAFSESHATYFGVEKSFVIRPKVDGIFSYQSPETAFEGKMIVFSDEKTNAMRKLASEGK